MSSGNFLSVELIKNQFGLLLLNNILKVFEATKQHETKKIDEKYFCTARGFVHEIKKKKIEHRDKRNYSKFK